MPSARAQVLLGVGATAVSTLWLAVVVALILEHSLHPPHVDVDLWLGLAGLLLGFVALGASVALLFAARTRREAERAASSAEERGAAD